MSARRRRDAIPLPAPALGTVGVPAPRGFPHWHRAAVLWTTRAASLVRKMRRMPRHSWERRQLRNQAQTAFEAAEASAAPLRR